MAKLDFPKILYKYRGFTPRTIQMLVEDQIYFANPKTFNDPLDTAPYVVPDLEVEDLEEILTKLLESRFAEERKNAAKSIKYEGTKTAERIINLGKIDAKQIIYSLRHLADDPEYDKDSAGKTILSERIKAEITQRYDKGIFCLSEPNDCHLMWSHYADEHRGFCIGYSIPSDFPIAPQKAQYGRSRNIKTSVIQRMLNNDPKAKNEVDEIVFLQKANSWQYEKEWRLIGNFGPTESLLEMEEIIFGYRCPDTTKYAVIKLLQGREKEIRFREIWVQGGGFVLRKRDVDTDSFIRYFPKRSRHLYEIFRDLPVDL